MSKFAAIAVAGTGSTAIAVGGVYVLQGSGEGTGSKSAAANSEERVQSPGTSTTSNLEGAPQVADASTSTHGTGGSNPTQEAPSSQPVQQKVKELKFNELTSFKTKNGYKCVNPLFDSKDLDLTNTSSVSDLSTTSTDQDNFFGAPSSSDTSRIKSCLIINGEKKTYSSDKWSGTFTGTGSFMNDNKGFVVVNIAKTDTTSQKLNLAGEAYLLEKTTENDQETWKVKYKKEVENGKEIDDSNFDENFPKPKADSGVSVGEKINANYGGFMQDKGDLTKMCNSTSCPKDVSETKVESEEFEWSWQQGGEGKKVSEGSEKLDWGNHMYGNSSFDLKSKLESFTGAWTKVKPTK